MKKTNGLLISVLAVGVLVLVALCLNLAQGGLWIISGRNGKNAYELAVQNGFEGTLQEWLNSLAGSDGKDGADGINGTNGTNGINGTNGVNGTNGKSAYEIAVENGFEGTLQEWLLSLSFGKDGADGKDGEKGADGKNGKDGADGKDGVSITNVWINENGHLMVSLSDGTQIDAGSWEGIAVPVPSEKSDFQQAQEAGYTGTLPEWLLGYHTESKSDRQIADIRRNDAGQLILTLKDGTAVNAGNIPADGYLSDAVDASGFRPRFEQVIMNYEAGGLWLRTVPGSQDEDTKHISISSGTVMVCVGAGEISEGDLFYQFYVNGKYCYARAKFFDRKYDDSWAQSPRLNLPDKLVFTAGQPFRIVTEELMPWSDGTYAVNYLYSGKGEAVTDTVALCLTATFRDGTTDAAHARETETLTAELYRVSGTDLILVGTYTASVTVVPPAELPELTGLFIGDSRVASGNLLSAFTKLAGEKVRLIGTLQNSDGIRHEGRGAWTAANFLNSGSAFGMTNAFDNPETSVKVFDFRYYMTTYYPDTKLDFVVINLGANDQYSMASVDNINAIIASIHAYDPSVQVLVMTEYLSPEQDDTPFCADLNRRRQFAYLERMEAVLAGREAENICLVPNFLCVDTWSDRPLKIGESGESVIADRVHLAPSGYEREASVLVTWLSDLFCQ